jgi:hypothetical protein
MRVYHFLATVTVAWSCGFYSIGLGQEGALPVTTDLHAHGLLVNSLLYNISE